MYALLAGLSKVALRRARSCDPGTTCEALDGSDICRAIMAYPPAASR